MPACTQCNRSFQSNTGLRSHCTAKQDHYYCESCNLLFPSASLLQAHYVGRPDHGMHYWVDCNRLISLNVVGKHLASPRHLRRATSQPNISVPAPTSIFSVSNAPSTPSVQGSPTTPSQPSPTSSQSVSFIMVSPLSPSSSQGTHASSSDNDWNAIESDVNDHDVGVVDPSASSTEPIFTSTASAEDETTLRERMEALRQQREAIAAQMRELERQEEEIGLEEQQIRVRLSSLENRMVAPLTPSIDSDANVSLPTSGVVSSPTSDDSSQHHVFDLYTNSERPYCPPCNRFFNSVAAFRTHCVDKSDHPYCLFCERWFASMSILQQHFISARNAQDPTHNYEPASPRVTETRTEQTIEVEARPVQRQEAPRVPVISSRPESDTRCVICSKKFGNKAALDSHQRGKKSCKKALAAARASKDTPRQVPPTPTIPRVTPVSVSSSVSKAGQHYRCLVCSRNFVCQKALSDHERTSTVHKEKKKLDSPPTPDETRCPLCRRDFKFPSAVADHIESGTCSNGKVTRHHVTAAVHAMNISPSITITKRIAGSAVPTFTTYEATELAFNGKAYECYLCHRGFSTLKILNTHLRSPAHDTKEFKCPHDKCKRNFKVLSALIRHIESECCGLAKLQSVRKFAHALTGQFSRMLTL